MLSVPILGIFRSFTPMARLLFCKCHLHQATLTTTALLMGTTTCCGEKGSVLNILSRISSLGVHNSAIRRTKDQPPHQLCLTIRKLLFPNQKPASFLRSRAFQQQVWSAVRAIWHR